MAEETALAHLCISDFANLALSPILSTFGNLALLASLRDDYTGHYGDPSEVLLYEREQTEACLKHKHRETFLHWLHLALAAQTADLTKFLASPDDEQNPFTASWFDERLPEKLIPSAASEREQALFMGNLRVALDSLRVRLGSLEKTPIDR